MSAWPDPAGCRAVLVGTTTYTDQVMWPALPAVRANVTDLAEVLTGPRSWGLRRDHCAQLIDPAGSDHVLDLIHDAATEAADTVLIYYSGHGEKTENDLLLPIATTRPDRLRIGGVRFSVIREIIRERRAPRAVVVLDCCYSGMAHGMGGPALRGLIDTTSAYVLTSSARDTLSLAPPGERHTAFTGELLKILQDGIPAGPADLSIGDVTRALRYRLLDRRLPLPEYSQAGAADELPLVRNRPEPARTRSRPRPAPAPPPGIRLAGAARRTGRAVGISFGATNSVITVVHGGETTVVPSSEGSPATPSVVAFGKNGQIMVGETAKRQAVVNAERTVRSVVLEMGTGWSVRIEGSTYSAPQIGALVLGKLKQDAEAYLGEQVTDAVLTVPAYYDDAQRQAVTEAGTLAGLDVLRLVNEPTAAVLAYGLDEDEGRSILVFDLGGRTYDVSVLHVGEGYVEVLATHGDTRLGGEDWDQRIVDELVRRFREAHGVDLTGDRTAVQRLREAAERVKVELTGAREAHIDLPYLATVRQAPRHLDTTLTRQEFQSLTADLLVRLRGPFRGALQDSGLKVSDLAHVVLAGGASLMPAVTALVAEMSGGKAPLTRLGPAEAASIGAARQASVLKADLTPVTLGLRGKGGVLRRVIERDSPVPVERTVTFTTTADDQSSLRVEVYEGEQETAALNAVLGTYMVGGIPAARRGEPRIEVTFGVDAGLTFTVTAREAASGVFLPVTRHPA
ncbi:Hsp70 family protein [Nonomuraea sp. NPDC052265]|uniref:caspase, EACC1-associated type n=1 Tax=Nonomuraea sp. NPDC052265 TaxID=3364374 RepID=UPI0037C66732